MPGDFEHLTDALPPKREILKAAYLEDLRYSEETLRHQRKSSPISSCVAWLVGAGMIGLIVFALLHHN